MNYILDDNRQPVPEENLLAWARWYEEADRHVAETFTELFWVSTVFLGIDHNFWDRGPPILFETMVFENKPHLMEIFGKLREIHSKHDGECWRYATWDDAEAGHNAVVKRILAEEGKAAEAIRDAKAFIKDIDKVASALKDKPDAS
ncbi:hypothetical protein V3589_15040 [Sinorhizobium fredii]|uniref:hypothetical protein n=1 Tax=Rhizobium fredii TaxID=380 RepID=UPI0030B54E50